RKMPPKTIDLHFLGELRDHFLTATGHLLVNVPLHKTNVPSVQVTLHSHGTFSTQHATVGLDVQMSDPDLPEEATIRLIPGENGAMMASGDVRMASDSPLGRSIGDTATLEHRLQELLESKRVDVQDLHVTSQAAGSDVLLHVSFRAALQPPATPQAPDLAALTDELRQIHVGTCDIHLVRTERDVQGTVTLDANGLEHFSLAGFKMMEAARARRHKHDENRLERLVSAQQTMVFKQFEEAWPEAAHTDSPVDVHLTVDIGAGGDGGVQVGVSGLLTAQEAAADAVWIRRGLHQLDAFRLEVGGTAGENGINLRLAGQTEGPLFALYRDYFVQAADSIHDTEVASALRALTFDGTRMALSIQNGALDAAGWLRLGGLNGLLRLVWDGGDLTGIRLSQDRGHTELMAWLSGVAPDRLKTALGRKIHNDYDIHRVPALPPFPASPSVDVKLPGGLPTQ
ncbi:MAG: hypothetical protein ACYCW6_20210, partial [Candidatus Xenobia bacterium]